MSAGSAPRHNEQIKKRIKEKYNSKKPQLTVDINPLLEWLARIKGGIGRTRSPNWLVTEILMDSVKIDGKPVNIEQASNLINSKIDG